MYTEKAIQRLKLDAIRYGLDLRQEFIEEDCAILATVCNGIGNFSMSEEQRFALTRAFRDYESAIAIDDYITAVTDNSIKLKKFSEEILFDNILKIFKKNYGKMWFLNHRGRIERYTVIPLLYKTIIEHRG